MSVCSALYQLLRALHKPRLSLGTENLALRQQLVILRRNTSRPGLRNRDRWFCVVLLSHLWRDWRSILVIVKPETVISGIGKASSAIGAGSPNLVVSDVQGLSWRFVT
jgi:hypothetical protein